MKKLAVILVLLTVSFIGKSQQINYAEYYINNDPGFGMGVPVSVSGPANDLALSFEINTVSLAKGYYTVCVRTQNDSGYWSMPFCQLVYIFKDSSTVRKKINYTEYYIDSDPGSGMATPVNMDNPSLDTVLNFIVDTTNMERGFHTINIRTGDDKGAWSNEYQKYFYFNGRPDTVRHKTAYAEYYIDTDPGLGLAIPVNMDNPSLDTVLNFIVDTTNLKSGFHTINIRTVDDKGSWSNKYQEYFYFHGARDTIIHKVDYAEYFFDNDPGLGLASSVNLSKSTTDTQLYVSFNTSALARGFHKLNIRARDDKGDWGLLYQRFFYYYGLHDTLTDKINYAEYFFDDDPGFGLATSISMGSPFIDTSFLLNIDPSVLSKGFHTINIRARDVKNSWGILVRKNFYYNEFSDTAKNNINYAEYFFDNDPGVKKATPIDISAPFRDKLIEPDINTSTLIKGFHTFFIRFGDSEGEWSIPYKKFFYFQGPTDTVRNKINYAEYFFDPDPGIGKAFPVSINTPFDDKAFVFDINNSQIPPGFHDLYLRVRDNKGNWSMSQKKHICALNFIKNQPVEISKAEYFIDNYVALGRGIPINIAATGDDISISFEPYLDGTEDGDHIIYIRCKNTLGYWGPPVVYSFTYTVGINKSEIHQWFHLYPNPSCGSFTIDFNNINQGPIKINISDMNGKTVYLKTVEPGLNPLSMNLEPGMYIVNIVQGNKQFSQKLIINNTTVLMLKK